MKRIIHILCTLFVTLSMVAVPLSAFATPTNIKADKSVKKSNLININTADRNELKKLYRVGLKTADKIIKYRKENGCFKSVDELKDVKGIGKTIVNKNRGSMTAELPKKPCKEGKKP